MRPWLRWLGFVAWPSDAIREGLIDMTRMLESQSSGAICDPSELPTVGCENTVWQRFLGLICNHCSDHKCVSNNELADVAHWVLQIYTSMLDNDENVERFGCKHGLIAALLFHSEHVALEYRRPSTEVEALVMPSEVNFEIFVADIHKDAEAIEKTLRTAGVPLALLNYSHLQILSSEGNPVTVRVDEHNAFIMESDWKIDPRFPLEVSYKERDLGTEFFALSRFVTLRSGAPGSEGEIRIFRIRMDLPAMSLAPFPFHTDKLRALRQIQQEEYDTFVHKVSSSLTGAGIGHVVVDNDYTLRYWDSGAAHTDEAGYLQTLVGLDRGALHTLQRLSLFVPLEHRSIALRILQRGRRLQLVDLGPGHVQYGERAFGFASALNFRVMCSGCLWVSVYFYVTEALGLPGAGTTVLPLAFWVPCRIPMEELFPVRHLQLGGGLVPRPPLQGVQLAEERWQSSRDPLVEVNQRHRSVRDPTSRRRSIYHGRCRESLLRAPAVAAYRRAVPELLPMHDMAQVMTMGMGTSLEFMMGHRQLLKAAGLELYQDKIQLSKDFAARGVRVPRVFFASYARHFDVTATLRDLEAQQVPYVAKAAHLCCGRGVFVMDKSIDRLTNQRLSVDEIQSQLESAWAHPFTTEQMNLTCGDWGTVEASKTPGVLVEELYRPSLPMSFLDAVGATDWISPDNLACHLVWSQLLTCRWEIKVRDAAGEAQTELLGLIFRDGSCMSCRYAVPFLDWPATVEMLETLLPHTDYVRISLFVDKEGSPVVNEVEYTTGGLEVFPVPIAREWNLQWLQGYYNFLS